MQGVGRKGAGTWKRGKGRERWRDRGQKEKERLPGNTWEQRKREIKIEKGEREKGGEEREEEGGPGVENSPLIHSQATHTQ